MIEALRVTLYQILNLYFYVVIAAVIASWLVGFGIINSYNPMARSILRFLYAVTEPLFAQIRRVLPAIGGLDLSPLIVILLIGFLQRWLISGTFF